MKELGYRKTLYIIPWISLLGGWLLGELSGEKSETIGAWLLLLSALLFGLPHGAYDFWILFDDARRRRKSSWKLSGYLAVYLLLALSVVGVWCVLPGAVLVGFLVLTAWHFGSGDAVWEAERRGEWILRSLGRGLLVVFAPLTFYPNESGSVLARLDANSVETLLFSAPYVLAVGIFLTLLSDISALFGVAKMRIEVRLLTFFETLLLLCFFWLTTPLLAVTIYLTGVHSWRHLLRIELYEQSERAFKYHNLQQIIGRFHRRALPITLISLVGAGLIFWFQQLQISDFANYTSAYLVLLSALTLPHAAFITWTELNRQHLRLFHRI